MVLSRRVLTATVVASKSVCRSTSFHVVPECSGSPKMPEVSQQFNSWLRGNRCDALVLRKAKTCRRLAEDWQKVNLRSLAVCDTCWHMIDICVSKWSEGARQMQSASVLIVVFKSDLTFAFLAFQLLDACFPCVSKATRGASRTVKLAGYIVDSFGLWSCTATSVTFVQQIWPGKILDFCQDVCTRPSDMCDLQGFNMFQIPAFK